MWSSFNRSGQKTKLAGTHRRPGIGKSRLATLEIFSLASKDGCWGDGTGSRVDETSRRDVTEGPFSGMGIIRFATKESLVKLYAPFEELNLEYSVRSMGGCQYEIANWVVTCVK